MNTIKFDVELVGDVICDGAMPVYDNFKYKLLGGFTVKQGNIVRCFLAITDNPFVMNYEEGIPFWITPNVDKNGQVCGAVLTLTELSPQSSRVIKESL